MPKQRVKNNLDRRVIELLPKHEKRNRIINGKAGKGDTNSVSQNQPIISTVLNEFDTCKTDSKQPDLHSNLCNTTYNYNEAENVTSVLVKEKSHILLSRAPLYEYQPPTLYNLSSNGKYLASSGQFQNKVTTNSRERWRQQTVNSAFAQLRQLIPTHPAERKMSKADILRSTIKYINILHKIVEYQNEPENKENGKSVQQTDQAMNIDQSARNVNILDLGYTESEEDY